MKDTENFLLLVSLFLKTLLKMEKSVREVCSCCTEHTVAGESIISEYKVRSLILVSDAVLGVRTHDSFEKIAHEGIKDMEKFVSDPRGEVNKRVKVKVMNMAEFKDLVDKLSPEDGSNPNAPSGRPIDPKWLH